MIHKTQTLIPQTTASLGLIKPSQFPLATCPIIFFRPQLSFGASKQFPARFAQHELKNLKYRLQPSIQPALSRLRTNDLPRQLH